MEQNNTEKNSVTNYGLFYQNEKLFQLHDKAGKDFQKKGRLHEKNRGTLESWNKCKL